MELNLKHVPYDDSNTYGQTCREIRNKQKNINSPVGGKNLALLCYEASWLERGKNQVIIGLSDPVRHKHSEVAAVEGLTELLDSPEKWATIKWLYTERAPCGTGPGMANCNQYLYNFFKGHSKRKKLGAGTAWAEFGALTPVYYSFQYPSGGQQEIQQCLDSLGDMGIVDEDGCITLKEYLLEQGKQDRQSVTGTLKKVGEKRKRS